MQHDHVLGSNRNIRKGILCVLCVCMCDVIRLSDRPRSSCSFNGDRFLVKMEQHARYERFSLFDRCNDRTTQNLRLAAGPTAPGEELLLFLFFRDSDGTSQTVRLKYRSLFSTGGPIDGGKAPRSRRGSVSLFARFLHFRRARSLAPPTGISYNFFR